MERSSLLRDRDFRLVAGSVGRPREMLRTEDAPGPAAVAEPASSSAETR